MPIGKDEIGSMAGSTTRNVAAGGTISVIACIYNNEPLVRESLTSAITNAGSSAQDIEFIPIDNLPNHGSREFLREAQVKVVEDTRSLQTFSTRKAFTLRRPFHHLGIYIQN